MTWRRAQCGHWHGDQKCLAITYGDLGVVVQRNRPAVGPAGTMMRGAAPSPKAERQST